MAELAIRVTWYEHTCEWVSKYCDEHHRKSALIPAHVLARYSSIPWTDRG